VRVLIASSEIYPFTRAGALSETVGALAKALAGRCEVAMVMPLYAIIDSERFGIERTPHRFPISVSDHEEPAEIWQGTLPGSEVPVYFVASHYFERDALYGTATGDYPDNSERFVFFSRAVVEVAENIVRPDLIHCNDWQTALVPVYLKEAYAPYGRLATARTVLTIHNIAYQGKFWMYDLHILNLGWGVFSPDKLEFYNHINYLKGGIVYADAITTVSHRYAEETRSAEFGHGLDGLMRQMAHKMTPIRNGIDADHWDPENDIHLPVRYATPDDEGRSACRTALLAEFGLDRATDLPLFGMVTHINIDKGVDLLVRMLGEAAARGDALFAILGDGEKLLTDALRNLAERFSDRIVLKTAYDERLAHLIHAGSDFYLMPSRHEPCGLNQMYAMRYGTVPVVRAVGGLDETVIDMDEHPAHGTGLKFRDYTPEALQRRVADAVSLFRDDRDRYRLMARRCMTADLGWREPAGRYLAVYERVLVEK